MVLAVGERIRSVGTTTIRILLAAMWLLSGISKLVMIDQFKDVIKTVLPSAEKVAPAIGMAVVVVEIITAICLLVPRWSRVGALSSCVLAGVFASVNLIKINEGIHAPCSCFGKIFVMSPVAALILDIVILLVTWPLIGPKPIQGSKI